MIKDDKLPLKLRFLEYYKDLPIQKLAAGYVGRDEDTIILWKKEDSDFSYQVELAKSEWAKAKAKRVMSQEWLLERVMNDHFGQRNKTDLTSNGKELKGLVGLETTNEKETN